MQKRHQTEIYSQNSIHRRKKIRRLEGSGAGISVIKLYFGKKCKKLSEIFLINLWSVGDWEGLAVLLLYSLVYKYIYAGLPLQL